MCATRATDVHIRDTLSKHGIPLPRESDADRIKKHGWNPLVECSWCGDTGNMPDSEGYCFCVVGTAKANQLSRDYEWPGLVPARFRDYSLAGHPNTKLAGEIGDWLDSNPCFTGENLVIQGKTGVGKTGAAIGVLRELHYQGASVIYWFLPDLMDQLRADEFSKADEGRKRPAMSALTSCDMLLLDDMGTERTTPYAQDRMHVIFDDRYTQNRPTILTTNYTGDAWRDYLGPRIYSRINESARYVSATGIDLRRKGK